MKADFRVCLDACVLANFPVADMLLKLAERPRQYLSVWSDDVMEFLIADTFTDSMAKRLLSEMGRGVAVKSVRDVGVSEPAGGQVFFDVGIASRFPNDPPQLAAAKGPVGLLRAKHHIVRPAKAVVHCLVA